MAEAKGRFRLYQTVAVRPGACFICRGTTGPFCDTKASVPFEGAIYVCKNCILGMYKELDIPVAPVEDKYDDGFLAGEKSGKESVMEALHSYVAEYDAVTVSTADGISDFTLSSVSAEVSKSGKRANSRSKSSDDGAKSDDAAVVSGQLSGDKSDEFVVSPISESDSESGRLDLSSATNSESVSSGVSF